MIKSSVTLSRIIKINILLAGVLLVVVLVSLLLGTAKIGIIESLREILCGWQEGFTGLTPVEKTIIFSIRLPRIIFAGIVGAALSTAGVVFQALLRNPLADPYILGISGGSAVGAIIGIVTGIGFLPFSIPGLAFLGAIITVVLVFAIGRTNPNTLLLAGVIVNAFFSSIIMFFISLSTNADLHNITFWLMGNLSFAGNSEIILTGFFLMVGFAVIYIEARSLNLIVTGEETATQLGVNVERTKIILFLAASMITGLAVSFSGIIGFVGLIIPHIMRMLFGSDHRLLLPASLLFGASFLIAADTIARTIIPYTELPVGVITAMCGAPYFIYLLRRRISRP